MKQDYKSVFDTRELARSYDVLSQLAPLILDHQPKCRVAGVSLENLTPSQRLSTVHGEPTM
jgi:hypothetical protein